MKLDCEVRGALPSYNEEDKVLYFNVAGETVYFSIQEKGRNETIFIHISIDELEKFTQFLSLVKRSRP